MPLCDFPNSKETLFEGCRLFQTIFYTSQNYLNHDRSIKVMNDNKWHEVLQNDP